MEYVYMQKPRPTNTTGVPVTISVVDSNGNFREIGTTTTTDGFFTLNWKPDITGSYTVYASFAGSESYYPSHAVTSFSRRPSSTQQQRQRQHQYNQLWLIQYFVPAVVGIIVAIAVGFAITIA